MDLKKTAQSVFERYKLVDKVFVTTDGQVFFDEVHAKNHASCHDMDIKIFRRKEEASDLESMDRAGLEVFVKDNELNVEFNENTSNEDFRAMIENAIAKESKAKEAKKTTSKKAKE
jgi:hypothetical protein